MSMGASAGRALLPCPTPPPTTPKPPLGTTPTPPPRKPLTSAMDIYLGLGDTFQRVNRIYPHKRFRVAQERQQVLHKGFAIELGAYLLDGFPPLQFISEVARFLEEALGVFQRFQRGCGRWGRWRGIVLCFLKPLVAHLVLSPC